MTPERENTEVIVVPAPTRETERDHRASFPRESGKHIVTGTWIRPKVVEQTANGFAWHNIGITPPVVAPNATLRTSGSLISGDQVFWARYDSARQRYSELSPASILSVESGDPGSPNPGEEPPGGSDGVDTLDDGIPLGIDLVYGTYDVRTAIIQRGFRILRQKIRLFFKKAAASELSGVVTVDILKDTLSYATTPDASTDAVPLASGYMDASDITATDDFAAFDISLNAPPLGTPAWANAVSNPTYDPEGTGGKYIVRITWNAATVQTDNCILVKGYYNATQDTSYEVAQGITVSDTVPVRGVSSMTRVDSTVTVVCPSHGFVDGETVSISGANQSDYNGNHEVTRVDANTFTFTIGTTPATPATGSIFAQGSTAIYPTFESLSQDALLSFFAKTPTETWLQAAARLSQAERTWGPINTPPTSIADQDGLVPYMYNPYDFRGAGAEQIPGAGGQTDIVYTQTVGKAPELARICSVADYITLSGINDGTTASEIISRNFFNSGQSFISFYVTNNIVDPSTLVGKWVRVIFTTRPSCVYVTGKVFLAQDDRITLEAWGWHVGADFTRKLGDRTTSEKAYTNSVFSITDRVDVRDGDRITIGDPDVIRASCYSVISGVASQDVGEIDALFITSSETPNTPDTPNTPTPTDDTTATFGLVFSSLSSLLGDENTDIYDQLVPVVYSVVDGEFYIQDAINVDDDSAITIGTIVKTNIWAPFQNYVFPACRVIETYSGNGVTCLLGAGTGGFDCFVDQPRLENLAPAERLTNTGIITFSTNISAYRDGQYLVTAFDSNGDELLRGYISSTISGLSTSQAIICVDFSRTTVIDSDGDVSGDWQNQRWEIRRQIVARAFQSSNRVQLFHDENLTTRAELGNQAWVHQRVAIAGAPGTGTLLKVSTFNGTYDGSLNSDKTYGNELVLDTPWAFGNQTGLLTIIPRTKELFFGNPSYYGWEVSGLNFNLSIQSRTPIRTFAISAGTIYVICEKDSIFELSPRGSIVAPLDFQTAAIFDVAGAFSVNRLDFSFSCVSTAVWTWPTRRVGFIASEGPRSYNGATVDALFAGTNTQKWNEYDRRSLILTDAAIDPQHPFYPCVRVCGMKSRGSSTRDNQLALVMQGPSVVMDFSEPSRNFDSMTSVLMENGAIQVLFGGDGRIWLYDSPPTQDSSDGTFLFPDCGGTQTGTLTGSTSGGNPAIVDSSAVFNSQGEGYIFKHTNIRVAKIDENGNVEWGTITDYLSETELQVTPDSGWTFTSGITYRYIIGAREWEIRLPILIPPAGTRWSMVETDAFRIDIMDTGSFDWSLTYQVFGGGDTSTIDESSALVSISFLKSDLSPLWHEQTLSIGRDYAQVTRISGLMSPESFVTIRGISQRIALSGG